MNDELKPCPNCSGQNLKSGGDDKIVATWCLDCGASGPNQYGSYTWRDRALCPDALEAAAKVASNFNASGDSEWHKGFQDAQRTIEAAIRSLKGEA